MIYLSQDSFRSLRETQKKIRNYTMDGRISKYIFKDIVKRKKKSKKHEKR